MTERRGCTARRCRGAAGSFDQLGGSTGSLLLRHRGAKRHKRNIDPSNMPFAYSPVITHTSPHIRRFKTRLTTTPEPVNWHK